MDVVIDQSSSRAPPTDNNTSSESVGGTPETGPSPELPTNTVDSCPTLSGTQPLELPQGISNSEGTDQEPQSKSSLVRETIRLLKDSEYIVRQKKLDMSSRRFYIFFTFSQDHVSVWSGHGWRLYTYYVWIIWNKLGGPRAAGGVRFVCFRAGILCFFCYFRGKLGGCYGGSSAKRRNNTMTGRWNDIRGAEGHGRFDKRFFVYFVHVVWGSLRSPYLAFFRATR